MSEDGISSHLGYYPLLSFLDDQEDKRPLTRSLSSTRHDEVEFSKTEAVVSPTVSPAPSSISSADPKQNREQGPNGSLESHCHHESIKMSRMGSRDDMCDDGTLSGVNRRSPSPPKRRSHPNIANISPPLVGSQLNGVSAKLDQSKIHNISRIKSEDMLEKPEKPERKFNSRELIEKQKKWTSHFTKTKLTRSHSDPNRCDIIRTVPGTGLIPGSTIQHKETRSSVPNSGPRSIELMTTTNEMTPPSPPARQMIPPQIKPRSAATNLGSPIKSPPPPIPATKPSLLKDIQHISSPERLRSPTKVLDPPPLPPPLSSSPSKSSILSRSSDESLPQLPERNRKKSVELIDDMLPIALGDKRPSIDYSNSNSTTSSSIFSPPLAHPVSLSPSPAPSASSGPSSPVHTEDDKQENESTEKAELSGLLLLQHDDGEEEQCTPPTRTFIVISSSKTRSNAPQLFNLFGRHF